MAKNGVGLIAGLLKSSAQKFLPARLQRDGHARKNKQRGGPQVLDGEAGPALITGWQDPAIASEQEKAFAPLLAELRAGRPRLDFTVLARAVSQTGLADPLIVEVGCGSGWNSEVLTRLLNRPVRYQGIDYSAAMIEQARRNYPQLTFSVGDAASLPLPDAACDILLSGTVLMHVADYARAIHESRRVTRRWCIFHTVPVLQKRETTLLHKSAYGQASVIEVIFNEAHLRQMISGTGLVIRDVMDSIPYDLKAVLGEPTVTKTFLCEVSA